MSLRVGLGVDAHRLGPGRPLMLGTVRIDHPEGLLGLSDGDVVAHAICDALLAAAGGPDIGALFPPGDPAWEGAAGERLVGEVMARLGGAGHRVANVHAIVIAEEPRIGPHRARMERALSALVGAPVGVHATSTDAMGFTGRGEGIACQAVALVETS